MSKPITETHPAFAHIWALSVGMPLDGESLKEAVQKTTVDVAEHRRLMKETRDTYDVIVERLKKEHSEQLMYAIHKAEKMGERRAMERVKNVIEERVKHFERLVILPRIEHKEEMKGRLKEIKALKNVLGIDKEEKQ